MNREKTSGRRFELRQSDKIVLGIIAVLIALIVVLNILQNAGLALIHGELMLYLPMLALFVLVGWGGYVLLRRIGNRTVRLVVTVVLGFVLLLALMVAYTYVGFIANISIPQRYRTMKSPSGAHTLVVLRRLDPDEERIEQRKAARLAVDPDGDPEVTVADWGVLYKAYPNGPLGLFYRSNADVEGEVYLTYRDANAGPAAKTASQATAGEAAGEASEATAGETAGDASEATADETAGEASEAADAAEELPDTAAETSADEGTESEHFGVMMMEWLDDESTAHFYVENPGVAECGECFVRF